MYLLYFLYCIIPYDYIWHKHLPCFPLYHQTVTNGATVGGVLADKVKTISFVAREGKLVLLILFLGLPLISFSWAENSPNMGGVRMGGPRWRQSLLPAVKVENLRCLLPAVLAQRTGAMTPTSVKRISLSTGTGDGS